MLVDESEPGGDPDEGASPWGSQEGVTRWKMHKINRRAGCVLLSVLISRIFLNVLKPVTTSRSLAEIDSPLV